MDKNESRTKDASIIENMPQRPRSNKTIATNTPKTEKTEILIILLSNEQSLFQIIKWNTYFTIYYKPIATYLCLACLDKSQTLLTLDPGKIMHQTA